MQTRTCEVAGMFYPRDPNHLEQLLERFFRTARKEHEALGIVAPHAGYPYSGEVAAWAYSTISPDFSGTFVVIGPSHRGYRTCTSSIAWETPIGIIENDAGLSGELGIPVDEDAMQESENSLEVQMPFIKYRFPRAKITPVLMGRQDRADAVDLGEKILSAVRRTQRDVRIVASSDFSHYVPAAVAKKSDLYAIDALKSLDITEFYRRIDQYDVSACGYGPVAAMVTTAVGLGAREGRLIRYATSGDVTGDPNVVGYAAIAVM